MASEINISLGIFPLSINFLLSENFGTEKPPPIVPSHLYHDHHDIGDQILEEFPFERQLVMQYRSLLPPHYLGNFIH